MISDVLFDAVEEIDRYLAEVPEMYADEEIRSQILALREHMNQVRALLDAPPPPRFWQRRSSPRSR